MTLTELSIVIWHDLAAPTLAGIATGLFFMLVAKPEVM